MQSESAVISKISALLPSSIRKLLVGILYFVSYLLTIVAVIAAPLALYVCYMSLFGGASEGELLYLDTFAPSKSEALLIFAKWFVILAAGLFANYFCKRYFAKSALNKSQERTE